jgi:hypothetical protein
MSCEKGGRDPDPCIQGMGEPLDQNPTQLSCIGDLGVERGSFQHVRSRSARSRGLM